MLYPYVPLMKAKPWLLKPNRRDSRGRWSLPSDPIDSTKAMTVLMERLGSIEQLIVIGTVCDDQENNSLLLPDNHTSLAVRERKP